MDVGQLKALSESEGFSFHAVDDVIVEGSRASSSRVREAILASDFTAVQKLLLRPFSYDAESLRFNRASTGQDEMDWFEADAVSGQILPKDASYEAVVFYEDFVLHTACMISGRKISLLLPSQNVADKVREIQFTGQR